MPTQSRSRLSEKLQGHNDGRELEETVANNTEGHSGMARVKKTNNRTVRVGKRTRSKCEGCGREIDVNRFDWVSLWIDGGNSLVHYGGNYSNNCADRAVSLRRSVPNFEDL